MVLVHGRVTNSIGRGAIGHGLVIASLLWWPGGGHGLSMKDRTHGLPHLIQVALSWVLLHHIHDGHPMALQCCAHRWLLGSHNLDKSMAAGGPGLWKAVGRPSWSMHLGLRAPWAGTWPAGSWGASPCKAFPMAVSAGGWKAQGAGFWKANSAGLVLKLHTKHGFCEASFAT